MPYFSVPKVDTIAVRGGPFVIGTDAGCDLRLNDPLVAPRHLFLQFDGSRWRASTLNLQAQTLLNGQPLQGGMAYLRNGDELTLGATRLQWNEADATPAAAPVAGLLDWLMPLLALLILALLVGAIWNASPAAQPTLGDAPTATVRPSDPASTPTTRTLGVAASPTAASLAMATPTRTPTPAVASTPTLTPTSTPLVSASGCQAPPGWVVINVKKGDTMKILARRYDIKIARLRNANCLENNRLQRGQELFVPPA